MKKYCYIILVRKPNQDFDKILMKGLDAYGWFKFEPFVENKTTILENANIHETVEQAFETLNHVYKNSRLKEKFTKYSVEAIEYIEKRDFLV